MGWSSSALYAKGEDGPWRGASWRAPRPMLARSPAAPAGTPPDPAGLFSEGGEVIKLRTEGSLMIPTTWIKGYSYGNAKNR